MPTDSAPSIASSLPTEIRPTFVHQTTRPLVHLGLRFLVRVLAPRFSVSGLSNVPHRSAVLLTPNHSSDADPALIYAAVRRSLWYMAKRELFEDWPVLAPVIRYAQAFPVDLKGMDRAAIQWAEHLLKNRQGLVIFPEGFISKTGGLNPMQPGAALLALRAQVPIVPVGLAHATGILPYGKIKPQFTLKPVRVHFGPPIDISDLKDLPKRAQREAVTERIESGIRAALSIARGERS